MKNQETKITFIKLRAEGKSYRAIEAETGISKSTCSKWEQELRADIDELRRENLSALYEAYGMTTEARIRRIGDTLSRIDQALDSIDFSKIPPEKLLDYKLKYQAALRDEYKAGGYSEITGAPSDTLTAIQQLYRRVTSGETTIAQAKGELTIIEHMIDAHNRNTPIDQLFSGWIGD